MTDINHPDLDGLLDAIEVLESKGQRSVDMPVAGLTDDSRQVVGGGMFVAVRGVATDGHDYIPKALQRGANIIVVEELPETTPDNVLWLRVADTRDALGRLASRWYNDPSEELTLVGVTGTNGKTTTATLLYEMARQLGQKAGLVSTVANIIDGESTPAEHTTPHPLTLNYWLRRMADAGCTFAAMEVSSHAADQHRIAGLSFAGGVFTNLTRDHLDYHKTVDAYLRAKKSFFDGLHANAFALVNADDRNGAVMVQNTEARKRTYSVRGVADYSVKVLENRLDGMLLDVDGHEVETLFVGRFNASNLAAVYGAAVELGWPREEVIRCLSAVQPVAGRFQPFRSDDCVTVIVDFAHTPDALVNVLDTISEAAPDECRVTCVCGAGGDRDAGKRPIMAQVADERCNRLVLTSDNPRHEDPVAIIEDMLSGLNAERRNSATVILDRSEAIFYAIATAAPGDVVLIAGKGHETEQIIGDDAMHFDDREEAMRALAVRANVKKL